MHASNPTRPCRAALELVALATGLVAVACAVVSGPATSLPAWRTVETGYCEIRSDAGDADIARAQRAIEELNAEFTATFAPLLRPPEKPAGKIRLVLFNSESEFRAYTQRVAPALLGSAGFYAATDDRLAILNQTGSTDFARARRQLSSPGHQRVQAAAQLDFLQDEARAATDRLIRHEAAHRLFHAYRIESPQPVELTWLAEGLAQYCETSPVGASHSALAKRLLRARETGTLLPVNQLLNHRDAAGFFALPADQLETAYAQSWALVHLLMQPRNRSEFFAALDRYRRTGELEFPALESQWQTFINNL